MRRETWIASLTLLLGACSLINSTKNFADESDGGGQRDAGLDSDAHTGDGCLPRVYYADIDGDGFGDPSAATLACVAPAEHVDNADDCDDDCDTCMPGASEVCDARDNDCDGAIDGAAAALACGPAERASAVICTGATCVVGNCEDGYEDCDDDFGTGCEADLSSPSHCGACFVSCDWQCEARRRCNDALQIETGEAHACAVREDGTVVCWGRNESMQLGDATTTTRERAIVVPGTSDAEAVASGSMHTCVLVTGGSIRCWGGNGVGQLGDGTLTDRGTIGPVVSGLIAPATQIAAGRTHNCVIMTTGGVRCWGNNSSGQIGDNGTTTRTVAIPTSGLSSGVAAITAGSSHTCALLATGTVRCWGANTNGALGDGSTTGSLVPVNVTGLTAVDAIAAGGAHTCALRSDGTVWCWGRNRSGELGTGTFDDASVPRQVVGLAGVVELAAGSTFTCARRSDGTGACWGDNRFGQLGDGTTTDREAPVDVIGLSDGAQLSLGRDHSCVLRAGGLPACWGDNSVGQLGDGSRFPRSGVVIVFPPLLP